QCAPHPVSHSFPTRRSSDLAVIGRIPRERIVDIDISIFAEVKARFAVGHRLPGFREENEIISRCDRRVTMESQAVGRLAIHLWRSEEHTSELQSRFDLVCRL